MSKPSKASSYIATWPGSSTLITYNRGGFKLAAYSDANGGNNPENGNSTSLSIVALANGPISFKVDLQNPTALSTVEGELVVAALIMTETLFFSNIIMELGFEK